MNFRFNKIISLTVLLCLSKHPLFAANPNEEVTCRKDLETAIDKLKSSYDATIKAGMSLEDCQMAQQTIANAQKTIDDSRAKAVAVVDLASCRKELDALNSKVKKTFSDLTTTNKITADDKQKYTTQRKTDEGFWKEVNTKGLTANDCRQAYLNVQNEKKILDDATTNFKQINTCVFQINYKKDLQKKNYDNLVSIKSILPDDVTKLKSQMDTLNSDLLKSFSEGTLNLTTCSQGLEKQNKLDSDLDLAFSRGNPELYKCKTESLNVSNQINGFFGEIQGNYVQAYMAISMGNKNSPYKAPKGWDWCGTTDVVYYADKARGSYNLNFDNLDLCKKGLADAKALLARYEKGCSEFLPKN